VYDKQERGTPARNCAIQDAITFAQSIMQGINAFVSVTAQKAARGCLS